MRRNEARSGKARQAGLGMARPGEARLGKTRQVWRKHRKLKGGIDLAAYQWAIAGLYKTSAQTAGNELERIYQKYGKLEPEDVVKENTPEGTPLHNEFEWDDAKAANAYRVGQAANIIRAVVTVEQQEDREPQQVRAFVHSRQTYHPLAVAVDSEDMMAEILKDALRDMQAFKRKYEALKELSAVFDAMDGAIERSRAEVTARRTVRGEQVTPAFTMT